MAEWAQIVVNLHTFENKKCSCRKHVTQHQEQTWRPCVPSCDVTARH